MAISGKFAADFASFQTAVDQSIVKLTTFEAGGAKVATSLDKATNALSGVKIVQQATIAAEAVERIGGVSKLTEAELARVGATATEAAAKLRAMGEDVPPKIQAIADAAAHTGDSFGEWKGKFDIQQAISDPLGTAKSGMLAFSETLGPTGIALGLVATAGVAVGAGLFKLTTDAAAVGGALDDMHDKTDLSVPSLSRMSNATKVIGADMGQLTNVVFKLQQGIGENTKEFQSGLARMGLSTNELKAAGPDRYLELVTAGLKAIPDASERAAAGTAVLGRGYRDVAAALMDLNKGMELTADITPWTAEQAAAAEAFDQQVASLETHVKAAAIALGNDLIPAASLLVSVTARTAEGLVHIADLGGLVSNTYRGLKGELGENALAEQTFAATLDTTNRLFAIASAEGLKYGDQVTQVASKLLTLGFNQQTVAAQTGLTTDQVKRLAGELLSVAAEADDFAELWTRVNAALAEGAPSLAGISTSTKGLVVDMRAAGVSVADMAAATGLSVPQVQLLMATQDAAAASTKKLNDEMQRAADDSAKKFAAAMTDLSAEGGNVKETLAALDGTVVEAIQFYLAAGKSVETLATVYGVAAAQVRDLDAAQKAQIATQAATIRANDEWKGTLEAVRVGTMSLQERIDSIDGSVVVWGQDLLKSGVNAKVVADYYGLTADQVKALQQDLTQAGAALAVVNTEAAKVPAATKPAEDGVRSLGAAAQQAGTGFFSMTAELYNAIRAAQQADLTFGGEQRWWNPVTGTGHRAAGGPVTGGQSYIVGERGPEIFTPTTSGAIIPNSGGSGRAGGGSGGGSLSVTIAPGAVVLNFPIMDNPTAKQQIAQLVGDALMARMKAVGLRMPSGA